MRGFTRNVAAIGVLAEPVRRELYLFVCSQTEPVTRDQAAKAMGIAHHQAKFHLDRLEAEGLLATEYVRLTGRSGPGAGRPSKRYRRGGTEIAITLPERQYEVAGRLLAEAITASARTGTPVTDTLRMAAGAHGAAIAAAATDRPTSVRAALDLARQPPDCAGIRTSPNRPDRGPDQLPVPGTGTQPYQTDLRDEPFHPCRVRSSCCAERARRPPRPRGQPMLRHTHSPRWS
jgi:hypothetical protein